MEKETCNTLKNQGDHFEHNDGHGTQNLSVVCAMLRILAFVVDQTQQRCCALFQAVWAKLGSKRLLWERMRALLYDEAFASMHQLCEALLYGFKKSSPIVAIDSSSSPSMRSATAVHRTRRYLIVVGKLCLHHQRSSLFTRHPVRSDRESLFKRRKRMVETLREPPTVR